MLKIFSNICFLTFLIASSYLLALTSASHPTDVDTASLHVENLLAWANAKGGFFSPKIEIRRWDPSDPKSYFGVFLNEDAKKDELLIELPDSVKIQLDDDYFDTSDYDELICDLAWMLKKEYDLGDNSEYAPYISYLKEQSKTQIPAMWTTEAKDLILEVHGPTLSMIDYNLDDVDGDHMIDWIDEWFPEEHCLIDNDTNSTLDTFFLAFTVQRGYDYALIPIYDMINHHNGHVNTITKPSIFHKTGFGVYALHDMKAGEELFYSYHGCPDCKQCPDCESTMEYWGTPEMLRDFGFVEAYPQRFHIDGICTLLITETDEFDDDGAPVYKAECFDNLCPDWDSVKIEYERLTKVRDTHLLPAKGTMPDVEYNTIVQYYNALSIAYKSYLRTYSGKPPDFWDEIAESVRRFIENEEFDLEKENSSMGSEL